MSTMKRIKIPIPIYDGYVLVCFSKDQLPSSLRSRYGHYKCFNYNDNPVVMCADRDEGKVTPQFIQALSHELNHAAMEILEDRGVRLTYNDQEPLCYLQDYLLRKVLDKIMQ